MMAFGRYLSIAILLLPWLLPSCTALAVGVSSEADEPVHCFSGSVEEVVLACRNHNCCTSSTSCYWADNSTVTICPDSCQGDYACDLGTAAHGVESVHIESHSCVGDFSCQGLYETIHIAAHSCIGLQACQDAHAKRVGSRSCAGYRACANIHESVGDDECRDSWACLPGVEKITELSKLVTNSLFVGLVVVLIVFLHPKPPPVAARPLQQEQVQLTRNT